MKTKHLSPLHLKTSKGAESPALLIAFCSVSENPSVEAPRTRRCKLLLHLGNSRAFSIDNDLSLSYDFLTGACPLR
jgi:hypothetical protein